MQIFCDLDGVLVDFKKGAAKVQPDLLKQDPSVYWPTINRLGPAFWSEMGWMPDGQELWSYLRSISVPWLITAMPRDGSAIVGKRMWTRRHLGEAFVPRTIICFRREKKLWAGRQNILIDDTEDTIREWEKCGGIGILHTCAIDTIAQLEIIRKKA